MVAEIPLAILAHTLLVAATCRTALIGVKLLSGHGGVIQHEHPFLLVAFGTANEGDFPGCADRCLEYGIADLIGHSPVLSTSPTIVSSS